MTESVPQNSIFKPTWGRGLFALALAIVGFLFPQEVPLEWYPLNEPGTDINYLEITCAANITNETQLYLDYGRGFNEFDSIRIPISPSTQAFTYTFPLQDAPLTGLRVNPYKAAGELLITNLRIINRRGDEIRRFNREDFALTNQMADIAPTTGGWKLVTTPAATAPSSLVKMSAPLIPVWMNHRNFLRCLLSTGYLAGMLLILLLAVLFSFYRPANWSDFFAHLGFMACLGLLFSVVGNRGLIRNSVHYSRYVQPPLAPGLSLELDLETGSPGNAQLFWDTENGYSEAGSLRRVYEPHLGLQTIHFPLPSLALRNLRFDPRDDEGQLVIRHIRLVDAGRRTHLVLPLSSLQAVRDISEIKTDNNELQIKTMPGGKDPIITFSAEAMTAINQTIGRSK